MLYKTGQQILDEGVSAHARSSDESLPEAERRKLTKQAEYNYNQVLEIAAKVEPSVISSIGSLYVEVGKWGIGLTLLEYAVLIDPKDHQAWNALGCAYRRAGKNEKSRLALLKALDLAPNDARVLTNMACTYINEGEPEKVLGWAKRALEADPANSTEAMLNAGLAYLELGNYALGWAGMETAQGKHNRKAKNYGPEIKPWRGEPNQTVIAYGEQGVGDEIMFAHCLRDLIHVSKDVILDCHPRLERIFKRSYPDIRVFGTRKAEAAWLPEVKADACVAIGSLPYYFRNSADDFKPHNGYVTADPALHDKYLPQNSSHGRLRVGLSWIGGTKQTHMELRSITPETLGPLLTIPGIEWVSLQYTPDAHLMTDKMRQLYGCDISHDYDMNADLDKLFGCIVGLDLVVTVPTSNVHFAGALGVPVWVATPRKCSWQFTGQGMDWYPNTSLYRQREHGDWGPVMAGIASDLVSLRNSKTKQAAE